MKLLVIQEQHFVKLSNKEVWVDQQSGQKFWERYLNVFEDIVVCARMKDGSGDDVKELIRSDRDHVEFIGIPNYRGVGGLIKNFTKVIGIMKKAIECCDCVIFRAPSPISMVAYPIVKKSGKPFAVEIMNNPATHFSKAAMHHFYQPLITKLMVQQTKSMCKKANGVSYVTENFLQKLYPSTAKIYGESKCYFEGSYSTINLEQKDFLFKEGRVNDRLIPTVFIHTGKMEDYRKGQDIFLECLAILHNEGFNIKGILVGDGELRPEFENMSRNLGLNGIVEFVGWKAGYSAVQQELQRADIAVFPSLGEGLPRSVIEAMANGLLCIGSKIDGTVELLDEQQLVEEYSAKAFADTIRTYLQDWNKMEVDRKLLFERAKKYESTVLEKKRTEFYKKLLNLSK